MSKVVMALSGGMDSTTMLCWLKDQGYEVDCVSFTYGAKHNRWENVAAQAIAMHCGIPLQTIDISGAMKLMKSDLLKSGGDIPEGHYTDETMSATVVPGRNMIFLSILAGRAWSIDATKIAIGIHQGDHAIYADCRTEFYKAMDSAIYLGTDHKIDILAPFIEWDKTKIIDWGSNIVPYQLTRTCYKDQKLSCGKCGACVERLEAFKNNDIQDPIRYEGE